MIKCILLFTLLLQSAFADITFKEFDKAIVSGEIKYLIEKFENDPSLFTTPLRTSRGTRSKNPLLEVLDYPSSSSPEKQTVEKNRYRLFLDLLSILQKVPTLKKDPKYFDPLLSKAIRIASENEGAIELVIAILRAGPESLKKNPKYLKEAGQAPKPNKGLIRVLIKSLNEKNQTDNCNNKQDNLNNLEETIRGSFIPATQKLLSDEDGKKHPKTLTQVIQKNQNEERLRKVLDESPTKIDSSPTLFSVQYSLPSDPNKKRWLELVLIRPFDEQCFQPVSAHFDVQTEYWCHFSGWTALNKEDYLKIKKMFMQSQRELYVNNPKMSPGDNPQARTNARIEINQTQRPVPKHLYDQGTLIDKLIGFLTINRSNDLEIEALKKFLTDLKKSNGECFGLSAVWAYSQYLKDHPQSEKKGFINKDKFHDIFNLLRRDYALDRSLKYSQQERSELIVNFIKKVRKFQEAQKDITKYLKGPDGGPLINEGSQELLGDQDYFKSYLRNTLTPGGIHFLTYGDDCKEFGKSKNNGHAMALHQDEDGNLYFYDPNKGEYKVTSIDKLVQKLWSSTDPKLRAPECTSMHEQLENVRRIQTSSYRFSDDSTSTSKKSPELSLDDLTRIIGRSPTLLSKTNRLFMKDLIDKLDDNALLELSELVESGKNPLDSLIRTRNNTEAQKSEANEVLKETLRDVRKKLKFEDLMTKIRARDGTFSVDSFLAKLRIGSALLSSRGRTSKEDRYSEKDASAIKYFIRRGDFSPELLTGIINALYPYTSQKNYSSKQEVLEFLETAPINKPPLPFSLLPLKIVP